MDTVAAPAPPSQPGALSSQSPKKNTASQPPPRNMVTAAQESLIRSIAPTPRTIIAAVQDSRETASPLAPKTFVTQNSLEKTKGSNHIYEAVKPTAEAGMPLTKPPLQTIDITAATQQSRNKTIVTPQGIWQNVAAPGSPNHTLPAVQNFLQMAFETVQRSKQNATTAAQNTLQNATNQSIPIATAMAQHPLPPMFVATPLSPQTSLPAPFQSLQKATTSHVDKIQDTTKRQHALSENITQTVSSTEASTSLEQLPSTSELKSMYTNQIGTVSKSHSFPGYTVYNTTRQSNTKPAFSSPKRSVLVAKRQNPVAKTTETDSSVQSPITETAAHVTPKEQNSNASQKRNNGKNPKDSPVKKNSSRVAQTFREYKDRGATGPQTSTQPVTGAQNARSNAGGSNRNWRRLQPSEEEALNIDPKRRVLVSGFPAYTQSQDLTRVMSRYGKCQVDSCRNRLAVVTYDSEAEARYAMKATLDINIYGEFVEVKPYTNPTHVEELYKAYKKVISTQKGDDITMPNKIDLTGDFFQQLENIQNAIRLTREQVQAVTNLYVDLEMVLQTEWPGCVAIPFGSIPSGLGIKSSDADCYVELPARGGRPAPPAAFVTRARRLLQNYPAVFAQLVAIPRANTPIVKFKHLPSGFHCDVSAKTPLGAQNSKLIKLLLDHDPRLARVAVLIKYWAKVHELSGTGRLTNYALTMMVIFYLQQPAVALVPAVERLQRDPASRYVVDHWNAGFSPAKVPGAPNPVALPDLLGGFFQFYRSFDFERLVVCPFLGAPVPKAAFEAPHLLPPEFARYVANVRDNIASPIRYNTAFCVQDPFEQSHNVASSVCGKLAADVRAHVLFAAEAFAADRAAGCRNLLRTILLTRPKLRCDRVVPTTSVSVVPRVRGVVEGPDWKATVREILIDVIFGKMLKVPLKLDEKDQRKDRGQRPTRFERDKYAGSTQKPVWRRRKRQGVQVSPPETPEALVARQAALTETVLADGDVAPLDFELEMWFREEPRALSITFKMLDGDKDAFRLAVTFLHTFMLDWYRVLVRPHLAPLAEEPHEALLADAAERKAARVECAVKFRREPPRAPSPPRLVLDPAQVTPRVVLDPAALARDFGAIALDEDTDSSDGSKHEPR